MQNVNSVVLPFGSRPKIKADFFIGSKELLCKDWQRFEVNIEWKDKPTSLKEHYSDYGDKLKLEIEPPKPTDNKITDELFEIESEILQGGDWIHHGRSKLFANGPDATNQHSYFYERNASYDFKSFDSTPLGPFTVNSREAFLRWRLKGASFQHALYPFALATYLLEFSGEKLSATSVDKLNEGIDEVIGIITELHSDICSAEQSLETERIELSTIVGTLESKNVDVEGVLQNLINAIEQLDKLEVDEQAGTFDNLEELIKSIEAAHDRVVSIVDRLIGYDLILIFLLSDNDLPDSDQSSLVIKEQAGGEYLLRIFDEKGTYKEYSNSDLNQEIVKIIEEKFNDSSPLSNQEIIQKITSDLEYTRSVFSLVESLTPTIKNIKEYLVNIDNLLDNVDIDTGMIKAEVGNIRSNIVSITNDLTNMQQTISNDLLTEIDKAGTTLDLIQTDIGTFKSCTSGAKESINLAKTDLENLKIVKFITDLNEDLTGILQKIHKNILTSIKAVKGGLAEGGSLQNKISELKNVLVDVNLPNEPYTPQIKNICINYVARAETGNIDFIHLYPFSATSKKEI